MKQFLLLLIFIVLTISQLSAQNEDELVFYKDLQNAVGETKGLTTSEIVVKVAMQRISTPYVGGTLEQEPERLIINLHETDCILFAESCLAFAITQKNNCKGFNTFSNIIQKLRYRNGIIDGYSSRIHYTSEWISQGISNGYFKDISKEIGVTCKQHIAYMSTHTKNYKQLSNNPSEAKKIVAIEKKLNRTKYYYIPKNRIEEVIDSLKSGDIVCFNTGEAGMDISHVGIIYVNHNIVGFIHASYKAKQVVIDKKSLIEYVNSSKSINGIRIVRPL
jgi:hypothetical protein